MSEQVVAGSQTASGGTAADQSTESGAKTIDAKEFERVMKDMHRFKSEGKKAAEERDALLTKLKEDDERKLTEQNEFKTLSERYKTELEKERSQKKALEDSFYLNQKAAAVKSAALKAGLVAQAEGDLDLLSLDSVAIERTDHGRMMVHGADEFVQDLKKNRPHWFGTKQVPPINAGGANGILNGDAITPEMLYKLEKSGKKEEYKTAFAAYLKQRASKK